MTDHDTRKALEESNRRAAELTAALAREQARRDALVRQLCDLEGASDKRLVAVR